MQKLFIGVDGGATKSVVRLEDESGHLIGHAVGGPANIRISVEQAWQSIYSALNKILKPLALSLEDKTHHFYAGMGLAGYEISAAHEAFIKRAQPFHQLIVTADSHTACLGAHQGGDGAIIIAGTGTVGYQIQRQKTTKIGGWGFPHDDDGGGAWLGVQAIKMTLQWLDGRLYESDLVKKIYTHFSCDINRLVSWANLANSTAFAEIAPFVIHQSKSGDAQAQKLLQQAAACIDRIAAALLVAQIDKEEPLPCALLGGVAPFLEPFLSENIRTRLRSCLSTPDVGAILLVRSQEKI